MKGSIVHPIVGEHLRGIWKVPKLSNGPLRGISFGIKGSLWEPSKSYTNALIRPVKFHLISRLVIKKGLKSMASTFGSTFQKEEVGVHPPPRLA